MHACPVTMPVFKIYFCVKHCPSAKSEKQTGSKGTTVAALVCPLFCDLSVSTGGLTADETVTHTPETCSGVSGAQWARHFSLIKVDKKAGVLLQ